MRFHFGGRYTKEEDLKSKREHHPNAVAFKEPGKNQFALLANGLAITTVISSKLSIIFSFLVNNVMVVSSILLS
jgi:hypothetical protein